MLHFGPFFKGVARIVLLTFYGQALWPTVAFAMDGDVLVMRPLLGQGPLGGGHLGGFAHYDGPYDSRLDHIFWADDSCLSEDFLKQLDAFYPLKPGHLLDPPADDEESFSDDESVVDSLRPDSPVSKAPSHVSSVASQLSERSVADTPYGFDGKGFVWSSKGYTYRFSLDGNLSVSVDVAFKATGEVPSSVLSLCNPYGNVILDEALELDELLVQGRDLILNTPEVHIRHVGFTSLEGQEGTVSLPEGRTLHLGSATLNGARFVNKGHVFLDTLSVIHGNEAALTNMGSVQGDNALFWLDDLVNQGAFDVADFHMTTKTFTNSGWMKGDGSLSVEEGRNAGTVETPTGLQLTIEKSFHHKQTGRLVGKSFDLTGQGEVVLGGKMTLDSMTLGNKQVWVESLEIHDSQIGTFTVTSDVERVTLHDKALLTLKKATIQGHNGLTLRNNGTLRVDEWTQRGGSFLNEWQFSAKQAQITAQLVRNANAAEWTVAGPQTMTADRFDNQGVVTGKGSLTIDVSKKGDFSRGQIGVKTLKIQGKGSKVFDARSKVAAATELSFTSKDTVQELHGVFQSPKVSMTGNTFHNRAKIVAPSLTLIIKKLTNSSTIQSDHLTTPLENLSNEETMDLGTACFENFIYDFSNTGTFHADQIKGKYGTTVYLSRLRNLKGRTTIKSGHVVTYGFEDGAKSVTHLPKVSLNQKRTTILGETTVQEWVPTTFNKEGSFDVKGKGRIEKGAIDFKSTTVGKAALLELGGEGEKYKQTLGKLTIAEKGVFRTLAGLQGTVTDIVNDGTIESALGLRLQNLVGMTRLGKGKVAGELTFEFTQVTNIDGFLKQDLRNWTAQSWRIVADHYTHEAGWRFPYLLTLEVRDLVNNAPLVTDKNLVVRCDHFRQGANGKLQVHGALDFKATDTLDNSWGSIQVHEKSKLKARYLKIGAPVAHGWPFNGRNGAFISCDSDMELDAADGFELSFGELAIQGRSLFKSKKQFLMNASVVRLGGVARFQVHDMLVKMNDKLETGGPICDTNYWHNQRKDYFTSEGSSLFCQNHVYLELASKVDGNLTLIASHFAALGNVYDHRGFKRTPDNLGTFQMHPVVCIEHAEKQPRFPGPPVHHEHKQHPTFSASGHVDMNFAAYCLGVAKIACASASLTGGTLLMDGGSDTHHHEPVPSVYHDLEEGLNLLLGGATTYRPAQESRRVAFVTGLKAGSTVNPKDTVIVAPRVDVAAVQRKLDDLKRFQDMLRTPGRDQNLFMRFMMDNFTTISALQACLRQNTQKGYVYVRSDGTEHLRKLIEAAQTAAQLAMGETPSSTRVVALEDLTDAVLTGQKAAMPFLAKEGPGGELLLSPLVIRPPQATDGMLQKKGAALVADDGSIDGDFTDDVYLKRTHMMARKQTETGAVPAPITFTSKAVQTHKAVEMDGSLLHFKGEKGFRAEEDHDVTVTNTRVKGGMSTITTYTSVPNRYKATDDVVFDTPEGSISLQHLVVDARKLIARAPQGQVAFLLGTNFSQTVTNTKKSTGLHTAVRQTVETHKTHVASSIHADIEVVTADTQRVMIQEIAGHTNMLLERMRINGVPATVEMIHREVCNDVHTLESHKSRSLTPICGAVIALAVTLVTKGMGAPLLGVEGAMATAAADAGFSTLCAHAATSWANHDGNIGRAAEELSRDKTLKAIALSAATAGATAGLGDAMGLPHDANTWDLRMGKAVVNMAATTAVHGVFGEDMADAAKAGIRTGIATVVQGTLAHKIGDAKPDVVTGLGLHGLAGGLSGAILGGRDGILPGSIAAMVGEGVAEGAGKATFGKFMGALSGAAVDMAQGRDGTKGLAVGTFTATTAVEENYERHKTCEVPPPEPPLTPRSQARKLAEQEFDKQWGHSRFETFTTADREGDSAYDQMEQDIAVRAAFKQNRGETLSIYETGVLHDYRLKHGIILGIAVAAPLAERVVGAVVSPFLKGFQAAKRMMGRESVDVVALGEAKGILSNSKFFQKHHIVSDKHDKTAAHKLWKAAGMTPNDPINIMHLPTVRGAGLGTNTRSIHQGRHLDVVNRELAGKMDAVLRSGRQSSWTQPQYADALKAIIQQEKQALKAGVRELNKHVRFPGGQ